MPKKYHPFESSVKGIEIPHFLSLILTDIYFKIGSKNFKSAKPKNTVINAIAGEIILFGKFILFNKWISKENTSKNNINVTIYNGLWRIKNLYTTYSIQKKTNIEIKHKKSKCMIFFMFPPRWFSKIRAATFLLLPHFFTLWF